MNDTPIAPTTFPPIPTAAACSAASPRSVRVSRSAAVKPRRAARRVRPPTCASTKRCVSACGIVVIYAENRSFANLYGDFPGVRHPLSEVRPEHAQLDRDGTPLPVLPKIWGAVPQAQEVDGKRYAIAERDIDKLTNAPFLIRTHRATRCRTA